MADLITLTLGTAALDAELVGLIEYFELVEAIDTLDAVVVRFDVPPGTALTTLLGKVKVGQVYKAVLTVGDGATIEAEGDIVDASFKWSRGGYWTVGFRGVESLQRLRHARTPTLWAGAPNTFFSTVAGDYGFTDGAQGVDGNLPFTLQAEENDAQFLSRIGQNLNYALGVEAKKLLFARRHVAVGSQVTLDFDDQVTAIDMNISVHGVVSKVTVVSEDYTKATPELIQGIADAAKLQKISGGDDAITLVSGLKAREVVLPNVGGGVQSWADAIATGLLQQAADSLVRGTIRCGPLVGARSGNLVKVDGAPWPLTGPFLIRQTRRVIHRQNHETEIEFMSDSLPTAT